MTRRSLHELLGTRWALPVLEALVSQPLRFGVLRRAIPGVAPRMLSKTARALAEAGLVLRHSGNRAVTYELTADGLGVLRWSRAICPPDGALNGSFGLAFMRLGYPRCYRNPEFCHAVDNLHCGCLRAEPGTSLGLGVGR